jgi:hypothetical protein
MRHASYERAFAGRNLFLPRNKREEALALSAERWLGDCKKKRVWVDFERDEIVVDKVGNLGWATGEMRKIRKLGVYRTENAGDYTTVCDEMMGFLPSFIGLRELTLYLKLEEGDMASIEHVEKTIVKELALAK